jgi:SET family sugar efflux transporter-like MFS transporter
VSALAKIAEIGRHPRFLSLSATALVLGLAYALTVPYLSLFALTEAHLSPSELGIYLVVAALSGVVATAWLGRLSDQGFGRKRTIVLTLICGVVGYAAMSKLRSFAGLLVNATVLLSIARAAFPQTFALARARFEADRLGDLTLASNTMRMFFSLAWVVGPALGALLVARVGFNGLYLSVAAAYGLVALLVAPIAAPAGTSAVTRLPSSALRHLRQPTIAATTLGFGLLFLSSSLNMIAFPLYVVETLHGTEGDVGWLLGLAAGLELPLMIGSALLSSRLGKPRLILSGAVLYAVYFVCIAAAPRIALLYPAQLINAFVVSVVMGLGMSYFQDQLPGEPGVSTALYANAMTLGSVLAGILFAALVGRYGPRGVLLACAGACLIASALLAYARARATGSR